MNNKRQTIWLVSMLSLMVILSAYYLFTEDVGTPTNNIAATDGTQQQGAKNDATEASGTTDGNNAIIANEVTGDDAGSTADDTANGAAANGSGKDAADSGKDAADSGKDAADNGGKAVADAGKDASGSTAGAAKTDDEVLKEIDAAGGMAASVFSQLQEQRDTTYFNEYNKLMNQVSDSKTSEKDAANSIDQVNLLEEKNTKITSFEEELSTQFGNAAVVSDAADHYKVVVQAEKLEPSQADSILTMAINELGLTPDQLTIQYVK